VFADARLPATAAAAPRAAADLGVTEIEAALGDAMHAARARHATDAQALKAAEQRLAGATAAHAQLTTRAAAVEASSRQAMAALTDWLATVDAREAEAKHDSEAKVQPASHADAEPGADAGPEGEPLAPAALRALLAHDAAWIGTERQALQQLEHAVAGAAGGLAQMRAQREAHESGGAGHALAGEDAPEDSAPAIRAALAATAEALAMQRERLGEHELALRRDDDIRQRAVELVRAIEAQEQAARIWWQMNELIGAADGKKFRNYAQQLTLDILLAYANAHLKDLARRYRLERVPSSLALMVIDQDMGDEQRSVHSLSGGESFLVSLALALGLASLSSHRVRVESLFIDEGFGSLDADTLRVAMDALDSLQAMGRKVGVISHVEEMTERIATRIQVRRLAGGQSRVEVSGAP
jgi:exonuclease SbcC